MLLQRGTTLHGHSVMINNHFFPEHCLCWFLVGVHPALIVVVSSAILITEVDFTILETVRDEERQAALVAAGSSWTMNSRHIPRVPKDKIYEGAALCHAVDLGAWVGGQVDWSWPLYAKIAKAMKKAAAEHKVSIVWGGDWSEKYRDGPHFELDRKRYKVR